MPRHKNVNGVSVQLTPEEEIARDAETVQWAVEKDARAIKKARIVALRVKLDDATITFAELVELSKGKL